MRRPAPLIVGGGPAGCAAAIGLARQGAPATILERSEGAPDALCGGFMSWRTLRTLEGLGVEVPGHAIGRLVLFANGQRAEAALPARAIGLSRAVLDANMRDVAACAGASVERGVEVRELTGDAALLRDGARLAFDTCFLATGKHDVRGLSRPRADADPAVGLRLRLPPHSALARLIGDAIELHLFDGGYAGVNLQEDGSANLCLAVRKSRLTATGGDPRALLRAIGEGTPLGERLAFDDGRTIDAIGSVPYGWRATETVPGRYRLGDQAAVIPSLAGEGMGIAIASGIAAAEAFARGETAPDFQRRFASRTQRPVTAAKLLWALAEDPRRAGMLLPWLGRLPVLARLAAHVTRIGD